MVTNQDIKGYAKELYQEKNFKKCVLYCATLLSLECLQKLKSESQSLYIPDIVQNFENQLNCVLPEFFQEDELWLESSRFILSYLEYWHTDPKLAKAVMREFPPVIISPSGHIQVNQIKTLQQAEDYMIGSASYRVASKLSEELNIPKLSIEELKKLLGIAKSEIEFSGLSEYHSNETSINCDIPEFLKENIKTRSASTIIKNNKVNKNNKNKKRKAQVKNLLKHIPEDLINFRLDCPKCSIQFRPDWLKLRPGPLIPIKPNVGPGIWTLRKIYELCPSCNEPIPMDLPVVGKQSKVLLFGDEAYREERGKLVFTYSLIGASQKFIPKIEESLRDLKLELFPSEPPESWTFHMKELWSGQKRKKHKVFCQLRNFDDTKCVINHLFKFIQSHAEYLFMYNIAWTAKGSMKGFQSMSTLERPQDNAYILLVMYVIHNLTTAKAQPIIQFDAERKTHTDQVIQSWAHNAFSGSQHCLIYPFLSNGIEIPEPVFVQPASHACLELADLISFIVARFYFKRWKGEEIEEILNPCNLGKVTYLSCNKRGDLVFNTTESYPW